MCVCALAGKCVSIEFVCANERAHIWMFWCILRAVRSYVCARVCIGTDVVDFSVDTKWRAFNRLRYKSTHNVIFCVSLALSLCVRPIWFTFDWFSVSFWRMIANVYEIDMCLNVRDEVDRFIQWVFLWSWNGHCWKSHSKSVRKKMPSFFGLYTEIQAIARKHIEKPCTHTQSHAYMQKPSISVRSHRSHQPTTNLTRTIFYLVLCLLSIRLSLLYASFFSHVFAP